MKIYTFILFFFIFTIKLHAQVAVTTTTPYTPDNSATLELYTEDPATSGYKGFLMTTFSSLEILAIGNAATGLIIYSTTENAFKFYNGTTWMRVGETISASEPVTTEIADEYYDTDIDSVKYYDGTDWQVLKATTTSITPTL